MKPILEVKSLCKQFADICAVDMLSFSAGEGEIIALLGPNGAGKSTLMNMITGYLSPDSGDVYINGYNIKSNPVAAKQSFGFLAEGAPLYGDMTVEAFLDYMAELKGLKNVQKEARLVQIKEVANIAPVWKMKIENLSKGDPRRVAFAQSILADPPILLLDEPTDGLDPNQKEHLRTLIKQLGKHKTIVISTHLLDDVEAMCNRIMIMNNGCILIDGTYDDILKKSRTKSIEAAFHKLTGGQNA